MIKSAPILSGPEDLLNIAESAEVLGVKPRCVLALIASRELAACNLSLGKVRPRWKVRRADLHALIERRMRPAKTIERKPVRKRVERVFFK